MRAHLDALQAEAANEAAGAAGEAVAVAAGVAAAGAAAVAAVAAAAAAGAAELEVARRQGIESKLAAAGQLLEEEQRLGRQLQAALVGLGSGLGLGCA